MRPTGAALALVVTVAACGGGSSHPSAGPTSLPPTASTTPSAATSARPPAPATAKAMIQALKRALAPITETIIYTAATDENHLLGRPSGYRSKGAWRDSRIPASQTVGFTLGDIDVGGGIEVFATREKAVTRGGYIQSIGAPIANEYDYVCGDALLRVSGYLTPKQARGYARSLSHILHVSCSPIT